MRPIKVTNDRMPLKLKYPKCRRAAFERFLAFRVAYTWNVFEDRGPRVEIGILGHGLRIPRKNDPNIIKRDLTCDVLVKDRARFRVELETLNPQRPECICDVAFALLAVNRNDDRIRHIHYFLIRETSEISGFLN